VYLFLFVLGTEKIKAILPSVIMAELLGLLIIIVSRNLIKRERPTAYKSFLLSLPWQGNSFPSHHALRVSMLATMFGTAYPSLLPFLIFAAAAVSISRIYLEKHYPFDILVGSFIGFLCAWLGESLFPRSLLMFGILPQTDAGDYLLIHCDITTFAFNHVGRILLV
jgi:undecaprenyl-diphosphatase